MTERQESATEELRIEAETVKMRLQAGVPVTLLDMRNDDAWEANPVILPGAIRVRPANWHVDASWPKDRLTVVY